MKCPLCAEDLNITIGDLQTYLFCFNLSCMYEEEVSIELGERLLEIDDAVYKTRR